MTKTVLRMVFFTTAVVCATSVVVRYLPGVVAQTGARESSRPEFTAAVVKTSVSASTGSARVTVSSVAVREDGSRAEFRHTLDGRVLNSRVVMDASAGTRVVVDPKTKSLTTYHLSEKEVAPLRNPPASCESGLAGELVEPLRPEAEPVHGYDVLRGTSEIKIDFGSEQRIIRKELWLAPALGCYPLKTISHGTSGDGQPVGRTVTEVVALTPGSPDPAMFALPPGYTERAPSEVFAESARIEGKPCANCGNVGTAQQDAAYQGSREARHR